MKGCDETMPGRSPDPLTVFVTATLASLGLMAVMLMILPVIHWV